MPKTSRWARRLGFLVLGLAALLALLAALAVFWLPDFARRQAEAALGEALHRPVSIGALELSPLELALTVRALEVGQRAPAPGLGPLFAFDELFIDLSGDSFRRRAPVVEALRLSGPRVHLVRERDGRLNIDDLAGPRDEKRPATPFALPDFSFANLEIAGGRLVFDDRLKASRQEIGELSFGIPFAGTLGEAAADWVAPHFRARVDGALVEATGKVKPFADRREATLELRIKDFDLTRIAAYVPLPPDLKLRSARLDLALDVAFVQAPGRPLRVRLGGDSALRKIALEQRGGAPYAAYLFAAERLAVKLDDFDADLQKPLTAALALSGASVRARDGRTALVSLPKLEAKGARIDLKARRVDLAALSLDGLRVAVQREADGGIDLVRLLAPAQPIGETNAGKDKSAAAAVLQRNGAPAAATRPAVPKDAPPVWQARLGRFALNDAGLRFVDRTIERAPPFVIDQLDLTTEAIDFAGKAPVKLALAATVNRRGALSATGSVGWQPLAASLAVELRDLDLVPLQPWAGDRFNALLSRGAANLKGQLELGGAPPVVRFEGDGKLADVNVIDRNHSADVLAFRAVELAGVRVVSAPLAVDLKRITLDELSARVILGADGKLNLAQLVKAPLPAAETKPAETPAEASAAAAAPPVRIGELVVKKSRIAFSDRFIKPNYGASISGLEGRIAPLVVGQRGRIDLRGAVDRSAPLVVAGEVDPFAKPLFLKLAASVKGVDMPSVSTYTERYLGYEIAKGKLSLDVDYRVENGRLNADNRLFLDQLTVGAKVDNPEAAALPVSLAISLLKNARGEIDLKLPVSGSLDDPEFSVGRVFWKVLGNLIAKAASSPFAWLRSLVGEDAGEIWQVNFVPGRATLEAAAEKPLRELARALVERPGLRLDVTGYADPQTDRAALAAAMLDRRLRARRQADSAQQGMDSAAVRDIVLTAAERARYLAALARDEGIAPAREATAADYEAALLARLAVGEGELRQLAERRGRAARNWLVDQGGVAVERVFVMVPRVDPADSGLAPGRAVFEVR